MICTIAEVPKRETVRMYSGGQWHDAALVVREDLRPGDVIPARPSLPRRTPPPWWSPAGRPNSPRWTTWCSTAAFRGAARFAVGTTVDPVLLEVFNNLFMNIAEQMGLQLQNTAYSVNIKERLDFSCALFDAEGNLIANAPHMPVHLGSMGESIKTVIRENAGTMQPGDVYVLNDPYHGGTHLPDVTVITPVYLVRRAEPLSTWVPRPPCRHWRHHAGLDAAVLHAHRGRGRADQQLQAGGPQGVLREAEMVALLQSGQYPSRNPQQNMADLKAQIAANEKGVQELRKMVDQFGLDVVQAYMRHVQDNAEESVRRVITRLKDGAFTLPLDNGAQIQVAIRVEPASAAPKSTSPARQRAADQQLQRAHGGVHGRRAVCVPHAGGRRHSAERGLPQAAARSSSRRLHAQPQPAGFGGGRQCGDVHLHHQCLYGALGVMAASQCTMNNFTFGNAAYQYYETISGGSGGLEQCGGRAVSTAPAWCRPT
jgi:5-oxoprolinase (ATP-hydrolysing)